MAENMTLKCVFIKYIPLYSIKIYEMLVVRAMHMYTSVGTAFSPVHSIDGLLLAFDMLIPIYSNDFHI